MTGKPKVTTRERALLGAVQRDQDDRLTAALRAVSKHVDERIAESVADLRAEARDVKAAAQEFESVERQASRTLRQVEDARVRQVQRHARRFVAVSQSLAAWLDRCTQEPALAGSDDGPGDPTNPDRVA